MTISNLKRRLTGQLLIPLCYDINFVLCRTGYVAVSELVENTQTSLLQPWQQWQPPSQCGITGLRDRIFASVFGLSIAVTVDSEPCTYWGATVKIWPRSSQIWRSYYNSCDPCEKTRFFPPTCSRLHEKILKDNTLYSGFIVIVYLSVKVFFFSLKGKKDSFVTCRSWLLLCTYCYNWKMLTWINHLSKV